MNNELIEEIEKIDKALGYAKEYVEYLTEKGSECHKECGREYDYIIPDSSEEENRIKKLEYLKEILLRLNEENIDLNKKYFIANNVYLSIFLCGYGISFDFYVENDNWLYNNYIDSYSGITEWINHFINDLDGVCPDRDVLYYPMGSGNDFFNDIKEKAKNGFIRLNEYLKDLPVITVKGRKSFFLNGIGYGIDGYCCEEGDRQRARSTKKINYTAIALKGLLFFYHPTNATITVDGKEHKFGRVFLAPTMNGRFFGGGMMIAPEQDRLNKERTVTVSVAHDTNRFNILRVFPSIFKGMHVKYKKIFTSFVGKDITVKFDRPTALQIDGETVTGVSEYSVKAGKLMKEREKPPILV